MTSHWDPGLQPERTELSWRRTSLSLAAGGLVALRLLPEVLGPMSLLVGAAGLVVAVGCWIGSASRARRARDTLLSGGRVLPDAVMPAALATIVVVFAVAGIVFVLGTLQ